MAEPPSQETSEVGSADEPASVPPPPRSQPDVEAEGRRQLTTPGERSPRALISSIWRQVDSEVEAALQQAKSDEDEARSAALAVRLALLASEVREHLPDTERFLELAKEHPLAPRLTIAQALQRGSAEDLRTAQMLVDALVTDKAERSRALRDLAEAWLYRFGNAERAARAALAGLDAVEDTTSSVAVDLRELHFLALAAAGQWVDYVGFLAQAVATADIIPQRERLAMFIEALHASLDWLDRPEHATKLVRRRFQLLGDPPEDPATRAQYLHAVDLALVAAEVANDRDRIDRQALLRRRLELVEAAGEESEVAVSRMWLAAELRQRRDWAAAAELAQALPVEGTWTGRLRRLEILRASVLAAKWEDAVEELTQVSRVPGGVATAYLRRLAELGEAHGVDGVDVAAAWQRVLDESPNDEQAQRRLELRFLQERGQSLCELLEQRADRHPERRVASQRRAMLVLRADPEHHDRARAHLEGVLGTEPSSEDYWLWLLLARLRREAGDLGGVVEILRMLAGTATDAFAERGKDIAGPLRTTAGFVALIGGDRSEAASLFELACKEDGSDLLSLLALAALYRGDEDWQKLGDTLDRIAELAQSIEIRIDSLCELARICATHLDAPKRARQALERAAALRADDPRVLRQLAQLSDDDSDWNKSVELRARAAAEQSEDSSSLLVEIGNIQEQRKYDDEEALVAYESALKADSGSLEAVRGAARIYRKKGNHAELLRLLRRELELVVEDRDAAGTHLDIARTLRQLDEPAELALASYREVLKLEPENAVALDGVEEVGRELQRFDVIAEAYRKAPSTQANLAVLAEALQKLENWTEFAEVRRREAALREDVGERARLLGELARIFEDELRDLDAATDVHREILSFHPKWRTSQDAVARLLEVQQSWPDLEAAWCEELKRLGDAELEKKVSLCLRIGDLRERRLQDVNGAIQIYREALHLNPLHVPTLEALDRIYLQTGRTDELAQIIAARAQGTENMRERASLYRRLAELVSTSSVDMAADAWEQSFRADPGNRETFTAMEKFCYENERWPPVMALYNLAIALVEDGSVRAYRLSDLYARRGHVELQFLSTPAAAAASYSKVVELEPDNDTAIKYIESIYSQLEDWPKLIEAHELQARLTRDPDRRIEALRRAARIAASRIEDRELAAKLYDQVLEVDSGDAEALDHLEQHASDARDWNKLVEVLRKRLESAPAGDTATELLKRIAKICEERLRDEERAITYYQRILEIAPGHRRALESLGRIYESTERWADFVDVTRRQIKVTTDRDHKALLYFKCGSVMEAKFGEEDEAIRYYEAAIKTSPSCMPAVHGLREVYRRREDWPKVVQTLELEVKLWDDDKERAGVFAQIGRIYGERLGHRERALHYFESALAVDPDCLPANQALFEVFFANQEWERALPLAKALAQKAMREGDPNARSDFYGKRGIVCRMTGDARAAAESLIVALEIRPENLEALSALVELAREHPEAYDFDATFQELERIYQKRDDCHSQWARVRMGEAVLAEREGDLERAEGLLTEAVERVPRDPEVLGALVHLHRQMRQWQRATDAINRFLSGDVGLAPEVRADAMLLLAEIHSEGELDSHRAILVLRDVVALQPDHVDAHYRIAQELFVLGRYAEAQAAVETVIALVAAPGRDVSPKLLARYYYYLGRILEAGADHRSAATQYRRAADYDPAYSAPVLALAKRAAATGDIASAQTILINAAHQAIEAAGKRAAVPMQRGLARLQLASGDPAGAIDAYRGMLAVDPDDIADRVALSELYVFQDLRKAIRELLRVIDRDVRVGPVYKLLASYYSRAGRPERTTRVLATMEALGFADRGDLGQLGKLRPKKRPVVEFDFPLDEDNRSSLLLTDIARSPRGELLAEIETELAARFPSPPMGENLTPIRSSKGEKRLRAAYGEAVKLFGIEPELYVGERVAGGLVVMSAPRPIVVLDRQLLEEADPELRFLLGFAFEAIRGRYALLLLMRSKQHTDLLSLLERLNRGNAEKLAKKSSFVASLTPRAHKLINRVGELVDGLSAEAWIDGMIATARRAGLLMCDDLAVATRALGRLSGEELSRSEGAHAGLGGVICGPDLVRFYLSDAYNQLRVALCQSAEGA